MRFKGGVPSHIAFACCGLFPVSGATVAAAVGTSSRKWGLVAAPMLLGMRADPSKIAEKFTPMNRRIMSCEMCGTSNGAMCDALKIWLVGLISNGTWMKHVSVL